MPDDEPSKNPFVRFKQHVDSNIQAGVNTVLSLPSTLSRTSNNDSNYPDTSDSEMTKPTDSWHPPSLPSPTTPFDNQISTPTAHHDDALQPSPQLEAAIDALRGGSHADADLAWRLFLTRSAYSPIRLHRELGWSPQPNDNNTNSHEYYPAPSTSTGWLDAFEDLLLASSGAEMADLRERSLAYPSPPRTLWHDLVHWGGGAPWAEVMWLKRLETRRLREVYFPVCDRISGWRSPATREEWVETRRREESEVSDRWREVQREFGSGGKRGRQGDEEEDGEMGSFFSDISAVVKALGRFLEDEVRSSPWPGRRGGEGEKKREGKTAEDGDEPETENDLYSIIRSAFNESERSLSTLFKSIAEGRRDNSFWEPKPASQPKTETTEIVEDGITKKTTKTEYKDDRGNKRSKIETIWTDEDGRVILKQVQSSSERSHQWHATFGGHDNASDAIEDEKFHDHDKEQANSSKERRKEGGWFWK